MGGRTSERIYLDSRHRVPASISSEVGDEEDETRNVVIWFINTFQRGCVFITDATVVGV